MFCFSSGRLADTPALCAIIGKYRNLRPGWNRTLYVYEQISSAAVPECLPRLCALTVYPA